MSADVLTDYWIDLIGLALALVFVNASLTGTFYTHGRRGRKLIATIKSPLARVAFLIVAAAMVFWLIVDLRQKLGVR